MILHIRQGHYIIIVEKKNELLKKMGKKTLIVELQESIDKVPNSLKKYSLEIGKNKTNLYYTYDLNENRTGITNLLQDLKDSGLLTIERKKITVFDPIALSKRFN